jgi:hypothetical protein
MNKLRERLTHHLITHFALKTTDQNFYNEADRIFEVLGLRWIPVEERVPVEDQTQVLVLEAVAGWVVQKVATYRCGEFICNSTYEELFVTHWMPLLPAPENTPVESRSK